MADAASHALKLLGPQAHLSAQLLSSPIVDVTFADTVGAPNQTAYLVTSSRRLYRSDDSGATWNIEPLPDADDAPEVVEVHVAAHDARHVFVRGAGITNWMSSNGGASYTAYRSGGAPLLAMANADAQRLHVWDLRQPPKSPPALILAPSESAGKAGMCMCVRS